MKSRRDLVRLGLIYLLAVGFLSSACDALQVDITPPPGEIQSDPAEDLTAQPSPTLPQPPATLSPEEIGDSAIVVNVIDQTGGFLLDQGLQVELAGYEDFELVYQDAIPLNSNTQVVFNEVPLPEGRVYFASIELSGAIYRSEIVELSPETSLLELTIQIFETTTNTDGLSIDRVHLLIDFPSPDLAQIVEIYIMSNLGDATVVAANPGDVSVSFPLPEDAESIEFENGALGQRYLKTDDGFGDTVSIPPGSGVYQVLVYYQVPINRNRIDFSQQFNYPVQAVVVMTPAGEAVIKGSDLEDGGVQSIPNGSVQLYSGSSFGRGESLKFRLTVESSGSSVTGTDSQFLSQELVIGAGLTGVVVFLVGIWLFLRQRGGDRVVDEEITGSAEKDLILDSIIALEDLYQEGEIKEEEYQKKRQEYKDRLAALNEPGGEA